MVTLYGSDNGSRAITSPLQPTLRGSWSGFMRPKKTPLVRNFARNEGRWESARRSSQGGFRIDRDTVNEWEEDLAPPSPSDIERLTVWLAVRTQGPSRERDEYTTLIQPMQRKRERLGISRAELSISLGVSKPQVYNWEEGHACPSPDSQEKIARWLAEDVPVRVSRKDQVRDLVQRMIERRLLMQMSRSKMASSIGVTSSKRLQLGRGRNPPKQGEL